MVTLEGKDKTKKERSGLKFLFTLTGYDLGYGYLDVFFWQEYT